MEDKLYVGVSPHIHNRESVSRVMWAVCVALIPSGLAGVFIFGLPALKVTLISIVSCVFTEALIQKSRGKKITAGDGSAVLTGILLAYNLSSSVPFWIPLIGSFAIAYVNRPLAG